MTQFMTSDKLKYYEQLFKYLDYTHTNTITPDQLLQVLRSMHIRLAYEDVLDLIHQTGNSSQNSLISLSEFLAIISITIEDKDFNEQIYEVFKIFDIDRNKVVDFKDLESGFDKMEVNINQKDLEKMLISTGKNQFTLKELRQFVLDK